ncbi:branched-chain amino acid ABC transporter substrate-binding protein, partial [Pseudonocardia yunnanensis]
MTRRRTIVTAAILAGALGLTACGTNREEATGTGGGAACDTSKGTLIIGMIAPLSGGLSALGLGMKNSADLAVDQANQKCTVPGYQLAFQPEDDQATPQIAGQAATKLASDPSVVGVVGTLNSSTAQVVQPILSERDIPMISPANTGPALTMGENAATAPSRQFDNYFRVATTDLIQGPFAANYLVQTAGKKNIAVIDDGKTYGSGLAEQFSQQATKLGAKVVAREKVGERDTDFSGVITRIRALNPDAVYYGGEYPVAGPLSAQLAAAGLNVPLMGGDGIVDAQFVALGGRPGDLATNVGAPAASLPSAQQFIKDYAAANYPEEFSA